jgi:hypothetical protein
VNLTEPYKLTVVTICFLVLFVFTLATPGNAMPGTLFTVANVRSSTDLARVLPAVVLASNPVFPIGSVSPIGVLLSTPSLSASRIDAILASYGSPAMGTGNDFYNLGVEYGIDPAYALAFFVMESSAGTNPKWDGLKPDGTTTHDIGNITCGGGFPCYGRWRDYPDWPTGIRDWYRLIRDEYIIGRGHVTVDDVIPIYAPAFENDVGGYTNTVNALVGKWRSE